MIPEDWETHTIGDSMRLVNGRAFKPEDWKDHGLPIIRIQNLNDTESAFNYCSGPVEDRHRIEAGNLLFAWSGTTGTSFGARVWNGPTGVLNQHIFKVFPDQAKLTLPYALLVLRKVQEHIEKQAHGFKASFVHVKKSDLVGIQLPLPPTRAEQRAIAEALSDADQLLGSLEKLIAKKRAIKQAAMQQLLTGKTRLPGFSGEWETKRLGEIASFFKGSGLSKADLSLDGRQRCIHYGELFTVYGESITKVFHGTDREALFFYSVRNDVLMPTSDVTPNGLATASCILSSDIILGGDILVIRVSEKILSGRFLAYAIKGTPRPGDAARIWHDGLSFVRPGYGQF